MAARPTWKGYLKISLVNIPVKVFPATDAGATIGFNQLHAECQTRIQQKRWCPSCQRDVPNTDIVKGYEFEKGRWVVMDDDDLEKVRVESTRVINLEKFTDDTDVEFYGMVAFERNGWLIGLLEYWRSATDTLELHLAYSRDGRRWQAQRELRREQRLSVRAREDRAAERSAAAALRYRGARRARTVDP